MVKERNADKQISRTKSPRTRGAAEGAGSKWTYGTYAGLGEQGVTSNSARTRFISTSLISALHAWALHDGPRPHRGRGPHAGHRLPARGGHRNSARRALCVPRAAKTRAVAGDAGAVKKRIAKKHPQTGASTVAPASMLPRCDCLAASRIPSSAPATHCRQTKTTAGPLSRLSAPECCAAPRCTSLGGRRAAATASTSSHSSAASRPITTLP